MRYIYGKNDFCNLDRSEENCYLMTNGLGGYSSLTIAGTNSRLHHGVFVSCEKEDAPNRRNMMVHSLEEELIMSNETVQLSSQRHLYSRSYDGYKYIDYLSFKDYPTWKITCKGVQIEKTIVMAYGTNAVGIRYAISNRTGEAVTLKVTPGLVFGAFYSGMGLDRPSFDMDPDKISAKGLELYYKVSGDILPFDTIYTDDLFYSYDECDGRPEVGVIAKNHVILQTVDAKSTEILDIIYSTRAIDMDYSQIKNSLVNHRRDIIDKSKLSDAVAKDLALAADQFVSYRASTKGETILAGYPFFEDWGRDTMIAMLGCCLSTRQYNKAEGLIKTFLQYEQNGLIPNLFPEGKQTPRYNTVDAALLLIIAVYEYFQRTRKNAFVKEVYPKLKTIIDCYVKGTGFSIKMDKDGLIKAGSDLDQVTWMDVRIGDVLPTPRHGKPVEVNAYWYNCLCIMDEFKKLTGNKDKNDYKSMASKAKESFNKLFWDEELGCLKDVVSDAPNSKCDRQIRCNQIWVVSLPFSVINKEKEMAVVDKVFEKLYTPVGLRSLAYDDEEFHATYGGSMQDRDMAYHQGTVWVYPLGGYYLAYLKANDYSDEAKISVRNSLDAINAALREGCIGQLPEIYDGLIPTRSQGCFAQAWSVGELLRVYEVLEKNSK